MKYRISFYNSKRNINSKSISEAKKIIKYSFKSKKIFAVNNPEGIYCYFSKKEMETDVTGLKAYAMIWRPI
jgi:predicted secreted protein